MKGKCITQGRDIPEGYIIGIDQGATNTRVAVMDTTGTLVGSHQMARGVVDNQPDSALDVIAVSADSALGDAGVALDEVNIVVAGIAGVDCEDDVDRITEALGTYFADRRVVVCNDAVIAYCSGSLAPVGAVITAGTGLKVALFAPDGSLERYVAAPQDSPSIARLTPDTLDSASTGDEGASAIVESFADELCATFVSALERMGMLVSACDIVLTGNVFSAYTPSGKPNLLIAGVHERLSAGAPHATLVDAPYQSVVGACLYGLDVVNGHITKADMKRIATSAKRLGLTRLG